MTKYEADFIIDCQNKSRDEILKAVAKVKSDYQELCNLKDMRLADLVKENAELKEQNRELLESCEGTTMMYKDLCKAKEIIKELLDFDFLPDIEIKKQAEQFLKGVSE